MHAPRQLVNAHLIMYFYGPGKRAVPNFKITFYINAGRKKYYLKLFNFCETEKHYVIDNSPAMLNFFQTIMSRLEYTLIGQSITAFKINRILKI